MKCCILAAGLGSRMGPQYDFTHKALLPLGNKAVLSHIIDGFPQDYEFVIAVGHRKELIVDYVSIAHPNRKIELVEVDNFSGPGSGPGYSLLATKALLQCPFIFTSSDTIIRGHLPPCDTNWIGAVEVAQPEKWCAASLDEKQYVTNLYYKCPSPATHAFTGIAYVANFDDFWSGLASNSQQLGGELQVNNGLERLIPHGLRAYPLPWVDTGTKDQYEKALDQFSKNFTFASKSTDLTYRIGDRVIKYFPTTGASERRYTRALDYPSTFAPVRALQGKFFSCDFIAGDLLANKRSASTYTRLLNWAEKNLWSDIAVNRHEEANVYHEFYVAKTLDRLAQYCDKFLNGAESTETVINGLPCRPTGELLHALTTELCAVGQPSTYHGDFHENNILSLPDGSFRLIDWRDSFGSVSSWGDRYYDLAKLLHTLELSVDTMERGTFSTSATEEHVELRHSEADSAGECTQALIQFLRSRNYDERRVRLINAIIFVNMAPLYTDRLANYLYLLGRYQLNKLCNGDG